MSNVIQFPGTHEAEPVEPQPIVIRVSMEVPEPKPASTGMGVLVALLCGIATFVIVSALL